ncbi:prephenate dehydrogenase [Treponema sp.]|uniref:prephenate dehydrogenase n=1 Tax=Treponema sp. TaxID=166 RepID=UPI00298E9402|nr:prephenate dehydrogenase [Treponema sp.]
MLELKDMTFGFVGLGLMGGSIAKGIKDKVFKANYSLGKNGFENDSKGQIYAMDINMTSLQNALNDKIIDKAFTPEQTNEMLQSCDFVFICLYPKATLNFLIEHKDSFKPGTVVTDISGVKTLIAENIFDGEKSIIRNDVDFILGHPMAGNEKEGYSGSNQCIFEGRNYILMPHPTNKPETISLIKSLVTKLGIKRIIETDYVTHDHKIAFTSQLCHVIASALVDSAEDNKITAFGGGSYEDLTRIAMINAPLWTELFLSNKKELLSMITTFEDSLTNIKEAIEKEDQNSLQKILTGVRTKRAEMQKI